MRRVEFIAPLLAVLAVGLTARPAAAEIQVTAIGRDVEALESTDRVRHFSFEEGFEVELLEVGQQLAVGDELTALGEDLFVELECPAGTLLRFTGSFRMAINRPEEGQDCRIESRDGKLDLLSDNATQTCVAGVCMATGGTRYAARFVRGEGGVERRVLVFEGSVSVAAGSRPEVVTSGQRLDLKPVAGAAAMAPSRREISSEEVDGWASLYATFDVVRARIAGAEVAEADLEPLRQEFKVLHAQVLEEPEKDEPRAKLAEKQVAYKLDREALYNAKRSGLVSSGQLEQNQIDPSRLRQGDPQERQRFEILLESQMQRRDIPTATHLVPSTTLQSATTLQQVSPGAAGATALTVNPPAGASADQMREFWKRQAETQEERRRSGEITSRGYLILARAYRALGERDLAGAAAKRALRLVERDGLLTDEEAAFARRLASAS